MPFELLSDIADLKMKVSGKTLQELFKDALQGVAFYLKPEVFKLKKKEFKEKQKIKTAAADINTLLVEFLSQIIAQTDIKNMIFMQVTFAKFGENFLEGEIVGVKVDGLDKEIKAVSYNEVDIKKNPQTSFYDTTLIFDV